MTLQMPPPLFIDIEVIAVVLGYVIFRWKNTSCGTFFLLII